MTGIALRNVRYKSKLYRIGEEIKVNKADIESVSKFIKFDEPKKKAEVKKKK